MTSMLVIDTTSRALAVFTANVTRSATGLVVRPGLEVPGLGFFAKGSAWHSPKSSAGLPILLLGDGYQARSSAGFVSVTGGGLPWQTYPIVGWLGDHGLRVIRPRVARLLGPARIVEDKASTNSNCSTADAVLAGLPLLAAADRRAVVIAEGQSDRVQVYRLLPVDPQAAGIAPFSVGEIEEEHRSDMFAPEAVAGQLLRAAYRANKRAGWLGPLTGARESVLRSAERIRSQELNEFLASHLSRGFWQTARPSTWEVACVGEPAGEGCAVDASVRSVPLTLAQMREMNRLAAEGRQEEADTLWRQSAVDLDLEIEDWERPLLVPAVSAITDDGTPDWERDLLVGEN